MPPIQTCTPDESAAELQTAARVGAGLTALAALGGFILALGGHPIRSEPLYWFGVGAALLGPLCYLSVPWARLPRRALLLAVNAPGVGLTALACWNTGGADSPYATYYVALVVSAGIYGTRTEVLALLATVVLATLAPLAYDPESILTVCAHALFVVGTSAIVGLLFHDRQERSRRLTRVLHELSTKDPLTGALNYRALMTATHAELDSHARAGRSLSVLYLDLDGFKAVNDAHGHKAGDEILVAVAAATRTMLRPSDVLARPGGDEFIVVLAETDERVAAELAARIVAAILTATASHGVAASLGAATFPADATTVDQLIATADRRMLDKKSRRRADRRLAMARSAVVVGKPVPTT